MVSKKLFPALLAASVAVWACSDSPVSPTNSGFGGGQNATAKGKPPKDDPPEPPTSTYAMTLSASINEDPAGPSEFEGTGPFPADASQDGLPSPGHLTLASATLEGWVVESGDFFEGSLSGPISGLNISSTGELPDWFSDGDPCQPDQIAALVANDLVGPTSSLGGDFSLALSQFSIGTGPPSSRGTFPRVTWALEGGGLSLNGRNGNNRENVFPVYEDGATTDHLIVTVENSVINFVSPVSVSSCRVDFTLTLTKVPQS